jgi:hypothetical protein
MSRHFWHNIAAAGWLALGSLALGGCALVAWTAATFGPPETVPAEYKLPQDKKVLVFVDDIYQPVPYEPFKIELARQLNQQLTARKLAASVVSPEKLQNVLEGSRKVMAIGEAGQKVGADLVVYVNIENFAMKDDPNLPMWHPQMSCCIRVIDSSEGRLWPNDRAEGRPVGPVEISPVEETSAAQGAELANLLAARVADTIAKLFCDSEKTKGR